MFGMGMGEFAIVIIVALVVMGPKELPRVLRKLGQWAGKLRRMAADLRAQSGIDDALRTEGLDIDIREIRKLARGELDGVVKAELTSAAAAIATSTSPGSPGRTSQARRDEPDTSSSVGVFSEMFVERDRENPRDGADSYGALPDTAIVYDGSLPKSALADDPLYVLGDASAKIPEAKKEETTLDAGWGESTGE